MAVDCDHCNPAIPELDPEVMVDELLKRCRAVGLRRTFLLRKVLFRLVSHDGPLSIPTLLSDEQIAEACDPGTLYRLMERLEAHQLVRRVGLHERAAHFYLNLPNRHRDFLVCVECGTVQALRLACPIGRFEEEVSRETGFSGIYHELQFYGRCKDCQQAG